MTTKAQDKHRLYEGLVTYLYTCELEAGDTFIDIGANVGHHTWQMAQAVGSQGTGFAVEPVPALAERVRGVLKNKGIDWVNIEETAVSDEPGTAEFFFRPSHIGWSSLFAEHVHPDDADTDLERLTVQIQTMDSLFASRTDSVSFIKLDIEHSEFRALQGATELLKNHQPMLVFENSPLVSAEVSGYQLEEFFDFFSGLDYRLFDIYGNPFDLVSLRETPSDRLSSYYLGLAASHPGANDPKSHFKIQDAYERLSAEVNEG